MRSLRTGGQTKCAAQNANSISAWRLIDWRALRKIRLGGKATKSAGKCDLTVQSPKSPESVSTPPDRSSAIHGGSVTASKTFILSPNSGFQTLLFVNSRISLSCILYFSNAFSCICPQKAVILHRQTKTVDSYEKVIIVICCSSTRFNCV